MVLTNDELKKIYFGAYEFGETKDGYLQAFQYSKKQIEYFKDALLQLQKLLSSPHLQTSCHLNTRSYGRALPIHSSLQSTDL